MRRPSRHWSLPHPGLSAQCEIIHCDHKITSEMKPSQALRRGKGSSMWNALEAVKEGRANAAVSAGNTGALMAISMLVCARWTAFTARP
jgi:glycerol-3-phosphate acyltransferase PlsX